MRRRLITNRIFITGLAFLLLCITVLAVLFIPGYAQVEFFSYFKYLVAAFLIFSLLVFFLNKSGLYDARREGNSGISFLKTLIIELKAEKKIENVLRDKETVLNRISDGMVSVDNEWRYTFLNDAALSTHPLGREGTLGRSLWEVHPEMKGTVFWDKYHEAMNSGEVQEIESFYPAFNMWFSVKVYPSPDGLTIFYRDITARIKTTIQLKESEERYRMAQTIGKMGHWELDIKNNKLTWSDEIFSIFDVKKNEYDSQFEIFFSLIHPDDLGKFSQAQEDALSGKRSLDITHRIINSHKEIKFIREIGKLMYDERGEAVFLNGTVQDVTDQVMARNEIIKEKNLSDSIINSLPGVFYLYTKDGVFLRWNKNFENVTQYNEEEIRSMHPSDFFYNKDKDIITQKIRETFTYGSANVQTSFLLKTGEQIPYFFTGRAIDFEGIPCLIGVGIDYSDRVKDQERINETTKHLRQLTAHLQNIREEERKRIGREIHDELGQQLTAIKMDIAWMDKRIPEESATLKVKLKNVIGLLDESNRSIRRILSELRPVILDDRGLLEAIEWLGCQLAENMGIPVHFAGADKEIGLSENIATCIFRVYQEAFTNILRYSGATEVWSALVIDSDCVNIVIRDNGKGFDTASVQTGRSFGILGMKERALALGGTLAIDSSPGNGTKITINLPFDVRGML